MGKFDGVLLVSDFDNTLLYTDEALRDGVPTPPMPERNLAAIRRFMAEGGLFAVATGRSLAAFHREGRKISTNAPTIVDNGGSLYDFRTETYLETMTLPAGSLQRVALVLEKFPELSAEICHPGDLVQVLRPCEWNDKHAKLSGAPYQVVEELTEETVPQPLSKVLFIGERPLLNRVQAFIQSQDWATDYELIVSSDLLLELTARGANKADMVRHLKDITGSVTLICAGDHANDLGMLRAADRAFCPANSIDEVLHSGAAVVCHCLEGAVGEIIEILERE